MKTNIALWLMGLISGVCIMGFVGVYGERSSQRSEVAAFKDDAEIAWRNYRDLEAEIAKCRKANAALKAVK